jgi:dTDP-4-amino-4,6-dideoxygalactose transaminase
MSQLHNNSVVIKLMDYRQIFKVPIADPKRAFDCHADELTNAIARVVNSGCYIGGAEVISFEKEFAAYIGVDHAFGVASGTDAISVALRACGVGNGDLVATVSLTAVGTIAAIELAGATPVLIDIEPVHYTLDPELLERLYTEYGIRAILPVHLYGHPANMQQIVDISSKHQVLVIEDCAQAHGAQISGRKCGTWGHVGAFSFYPTKNLGCIGDGGAIVTNDCNLAENIALQREYGWKERFVSLVPGMNSRLDPIQAAVLRVKLKYLEQSNKRRQEVAGFYSAALANRNITLPTARSEASHVYHQYVIRTDLRDRLRAYLEKKGIQATVHYPMPIHEQPGYKGRIRVFGNRLPNTVQTCSEILSLPCYPELTDKEVELVIGYVLSFYRGETFKDVRL